MQGTTVCRMHGGAAPQVRRRAEQRILEASDKAAYTLVQIMQDPTTPLSIKLAAARDLLDRASLTGKQELDIAVKVSKFDQVGRDIVMDIEAVSSEFSYDDSNVIDAELMDDIPEYDDDEPAQPVRQHAPLEVAPAPRRKPQRRKPAAQPKQPAPMRSTTAQPGEPEPMRVATGKVRPAKPKPKSEDEIEDEILQRDVERTRQYKRRGGLRD